MDIRTSGKNLRITKGIQEHLDEKLGRLEKYSSRIVECHVVLKKEKYIYAAQLTLLGKKQHVYGEGSAKENIYAAIDQAIDRVQKQLKKSRDKIKDHHKEHGGRAVAVKERVATKLHRVNLKSSRPSVIEMPVFAPKPMSVREASMQLEIGKEPFLVFSDAATNRPNVIFKRKDGNHGLIIPEF